MPNEPTRSAAYERYLERLVDPGVAAEDLPPRVGAGPDVADEVADRLASMESDLLDLSHTVHAHPELGFEEHHAAAAVAEVVSDHGVDIEVGTFGLETSFQAQAGSGDPTVAILAEYDALPGIGHGCGHNIICAAGIGAFLTAATLVDTVGGSVRLIGTPAEEGGSGKELIAREGGFEDVDCAMMIHPGGTGSAACSYLGMRQVDVSWRGLEAHASAVAYMGRNALDACVTAYNLVGQLRQHMLPEDRVHGVITHGGDRPNIIPDHAAASYYVRSGHVETLVELTERMDAIFFAAAAASGTVAEPNWDPNPLVLPVRNNMALARRFALSFTARGKEMPLRSPVPSGSTDMGNVSVRVPSIHPKVGVGAPGVPVHTAEFARHAGGEGGDRAVMDGAYGLAMTALDFLADESLRHDVESEFMAGGGVVDVEALDK